MRIPPFGEVLCVVAALLAIGLRQPEWATTLYAAAIYARLTRTDRDSR